MMIDNFIGVTLIRLRLGESGAHLINGFHGNKNFALTLNSTKVIAENFFTLHDNYAVVAGTKLCCLSQKLFDLMSVIELQ